MKLTFEKGDNESYVDYWHRLDWIKRRNNTIRAILDGPERDLLNSSLVVAESNASVTGCDPRQLSSHSRLSLGADRDYPESEAARECKEKIKGLRDALASTDRNVIVKWLRDGLPDQPDVTDAVRQCKKLIKDALNDLSPADRDMTLLSVRWDTD